MNDIQKIIIKCDEAMNKSYELNRLNQCLFDFIEKQGLEAEWISFAKKMGYINGQIRIKEQLQEKQPNHFTT